MKNFTLFLSFLLISVAINAHAQNKSEIQVRLHAMQKEYAEINQRIKWANKIVKQENSGLRLKSDAISQKLDSTVNQVYNDLGSVWQRDYKDEFLYDEQMRNTDWIAKEFDLSGGTSETVYRVSLEYDGSSRVASMYMYDIDSVSGVFAVSGRFDYLYNSEGMTDTVFSYFSQDAGMNWDLLMKQAYQYNASEQLIKTESWMFDEDLGALVLSARTDLSYNGNGKIQTSLTSYLFDGDEYPFDKSEYAYNGSNQLTSIEYYGLNFFTFELEKNSRDLFQYNENGDVSTQVYSSLSGTVWMDEDKEEYEYTTMDMSEVAFPVFIALWSEEDGVNELKYGKAIHMINSYEMSGGSWKHTDINTFYYSGGPSTNIDNFAGADFRFYPNPVSETVTFNWKENNSRLMVKMYQVTGAQVLEQNISSGQAISLTNLVNGIYLVKLLKGQQVVYAGKLVKRQ